MVLSSVWRSGRWGWDLKNFNFVEVVGEDEGGDGGDGDDDGDNDGDDDSDDDDRVVS